MNLALPKPLKHCEFQASSKESFLQSLDLSSTVQSRIPNLFIEGVMLCQNLL